MQFENDRKWNDQLLRENDQESHVRNTYRHLEMLTRVILLGRWIRRFRNEPRRFEINPVEMITVTTRIVRSETYMWLLSVNPWLFSKIRAYVFTCKYFLRLVDAKLIATIRKIRMHACIA